MVPDRGEAFSGGRREPKQSADGDVCRGCDEGSQQQRRSCDLADRPENTGQAERPQNSQLPRQTLHYPSSRSVIPRQALTSVTVFFVLLKYRGCFAVLGAVAVLLLCSRPRRAPSRQLHLRTAAQSRPDAALLSRQMWGLADAAVSRQPWAAPASLRGAGERGAMGSCSRLLSGCPSGGMGDGFRAENVAGEAPGKLES